LAWHCGGTATWLIFAQLGLKNFRWSRTNFPFITSAPSLQAGLVLTNLHIQSLMAFDEGNSASCGHMSCHFPDADLAKESMKLIPADRVLPREADICRRIPAPDKNVALQPDTHFC
jgi:hypothetical protein